MEIWIRVCDFNTHLRCIQVDAMYIFMRLCIAALQRPGKESYHSPPLPPSFSLQLRLSLFTRLADGYIFVTSQSVSFPLLLLLLPLVLQWTDVAFSLSENAKDALSYLKILHLSLETISLCVTDQHQDSPASLVASD